MPDAAKTRKRRERAPSAGARYGDAAGGKGAKAESRKRISLSSEGLALIGLHRGERRGLAPREQEP